MHITEEMVDKNMQTNVVPLAEKLSQTKPSNIEPIISPTPKPTRTYKHFSYFFSFDQSIVDGVTCIVQVIKGTKTFVMTEPLKADQMIKGVILRIL